MGSRGLQVLVATAVDALPILPIGVGGVAAPGAGGEVARAAGVASAAEAGSSFVGLAPARLADSRPGAATVDVVCV